MEDEATISSCSTCSESTEQSCVIAIGGNFTKFLFYALVFELYTKENISCEVVELYMDELWRRVTNFDKIYYVPYSHFDKPEKQVSNFRRRLAGCYLYISDYDNIVKVGYVVILCAVVCNCLYERHINQ